MAADYDRRRPDGTFLPGAGGRPKGSRNRLSEAFLRVLADDFEQNGMEAIERLRSDNPGTYANVIAKLMPKLMELSGPDGEEIKQRVHRTLELVEPGDSLKARTRDPLAEGDD